MAVANNPYKRLAYEGIPKLSNKEKVRVNRKGSEYNPRETMLIECLQNGGRTKDVEEETTFPTLIIIIEQQTTGGKLSYYLTETTFCHDRIIQKHRGKHNQNNDKKGK